jgi:hypothetical protein
MKIFSPNYRTFSFDEKWQHKIVERTGTFVSYGFELNSWFTSYCLGYLG